MTTRIGTESAASESERRKYFVLEKRLRQAARAGVLKGRTIPKAKLEFMRADGQGAPVKYSEVELENVLISNMDQLVDEGSVLDDSLGLKFSKVKWQYTRPAAGTCRPTE